MEKRKDLELVPIRWLIGLQFSIQAEIRTLKNSPHSLRWSDLSAEIFLHDCMQHQADS